MNHERGKLFLRLIIDANERVACAATKYVNYNKRKAPKIIIDNQYRLLTEAVEKREQIYHAMDNIERQEALEQGEMDCNKCCYHDDGFCLLKHEEIDSPDDVGCEYWMSREYGEE